jgi:nucleotide-binding universal stress UspA family protein
MFKKIMVATDGSQTSIRTAELAVGLARLSGGSIIAIYVVDLYRLAHLPGYAAFPSLSSRLMELMQREGELAISEVENMACDAGVPFSSIIAEGDPSQEIVKRSHKSGADLLVLGRIGRSDLEKILLGCVAEKVVRHSKIPVLIVPAVRK